MQKRKEQSQKKKQPIKSEKTKENKTMAKSDDLRYPNADEIYE